MRFFRPILLRCHLEHDLDSNSLLTVGDFLELTKRKRLGIVNHGQSSGFVEFSRLAKGKQLDNVVFGISIEFLIKGREESLYLYPVDEEAYRRILTLSLVGLERRNVKNILSDDDIVKIHPLKDTYQVSNLSSYVKRNFFWGLDRDFHSLGNEFLRKVALLDEPIVAFPRVKYTDNYELYDLYESIRNGEPYYKPNREKAKRYHIPDMKELWEAYSIVPEALLNTWIVFSRARFRFRRLPYDFNFFNDDGMDRKLVKACMDNIVALGLNRKRYLRQILYEVRVIVSKRLPPYFMLIKTITDYCHDNSIIVGPRGSAAGALVSYALGITHIDPLKYHLFFERFLDPSRLDLPDYDLDFPSSCRAQLLSFITDKWSDRFTLTHIRTKMHLKAKNSIRLVGKAMGLSAFEINTLVDFIREISTEKVTLRSTLEGDAQLQNLLLLDPKKAKVYELASLLEGKITNFALHAAGVILVRNDNINLIGIRELDDARVLDHDMHDLDYLGLIKVDILGIDALSIIDRVLRDTGLRLNDVPLDDQETFDTIRRGYTYGLFQLSYVNSEIAKLIKTGSIQDIADVIGLNRPGSMHYIDLFIRRKMGLEEVTYDHPALEPILRDTVGIFIWQEQIMQMAVQLAHYTVLEANELRKIIGKKIFDRMIEHKDKFIAGASREMGLAQAESLFSIVQEFKGYGFNKAHGVAYAHNTYYMAYLLTHYPLEYYASAINYEHQEHKKVNLIQLASASGIRILPPHLEYSDELFLIEGDAIRFGLGMIKHLSKNCIGKVIAARGRSNILENIGSRIPGLTSSEEQLISDLFRNSSFIEDKGAQYRYLNLILKDLDAKRNENLSDWVFNHCLKEDKVMTFKVRILKVQNAGTLQELRLRDNKRTRQFSRSKSITISDGSFTLCLVVSHEQPLQFLNRMQSKLDNYSWYDVTLNFGRSVKNIEVNRIQ